ncbi:MAG: hypothetical protein SFW66_09910 [Gammaproteobacteria bacterium]|nr:hypothetical protein [Gammaproteobacteria bacterium]
MQSNMMARYEYQVKRKKDSSLRGYEVLSRGKPVFVSIPKNWLATPKRCRGLAMTRPCYRSPIIYA